MWPTINHSLVRERVNEFDAIPDRVQERIDRFGKQVKIIEKYVPAFNQEFPSILNLLYEASDLSNDTEDHFEKRIIYMAESLW